MKKVTIRPMNFAYFCIYFFTLLFWGFAIWKITDFLLNDKPLSYLAWILIIFSTAIFTFLSLQLLKEKIVFDGNKVKISKATWLKVSKKEKGKKTFSLFRTSRHPWFTSGHAYERKIVVKRFNINALDKYGLTKDLNIDSIESYPEFAQGFPTKEIVFIINDGSMTSLNAKPYTKRSLRKLKNYIASRTGLNPIGELNDL